MPSCQPLSSARFHKAPLSPAPHRTWSNSCNSPFILSPHYRLLYSLGRTAHAVGSLQRANASPKSTLSGHHRATGTVRGADKVCMPSRRCASQAINDWLVLLQVLKNTTISLAAPQNNTSFGYLSQFCINKWGEPMQRYSTGVGTRRGLV